MDSIDLQVLKTINDWSNQNKKVVMGTIVQTWGSSPRPPGAIVGIEGIRQSSWICFWRLSRR